MADAKESSPTKLIKEFFEMPAKDAIKEFKQLTADDKTQLADGIRDGSLTY